MSERRSSLWSPRQNSARKDTVCETLATSGLTQQRRPASTGSALFRCGILNISGSNLMLPTSLKSGKNQFNSMFRFMFDGRGYKTPVVKKNKNPRFPSIFEWVWHCDPSMLATQELVVDYAFAYKGKTTIAGKATVDAMSIATGPVKWELELFSTKEKESVGFVNFEFHMEQFTQASLHCEFLIVPTDRSKVCDQLFPETVQLPALIKNLPRERSKPLDALNSDKFVVDTKFEASMKGGLLVILKPKNKKVARDPLVGCYFRIPFGEVVTIEAGKVVPYRANLALQGKIIGHAEITCAWTNMCSYAQMVGGYYNSRSGIVGANAVPGVHAPVIKGKKHAQTETNLTISHVIEVGQVAEIPDVQDSDDDDDDFNFNMNLPAGWEEIKDNQGKTVYKNFITGHTQYNHPFKPPSDTDEGEVAPPRKRPDLISRPSQMFSGFSNQIDATQIKEAKTYSKKPLPTRDTVDDDWAEAGSDCEGEESNVSTTTGSYQSVYSAPPILASSPSRSPTRLPERPNPLPPGASASSVPGLNPFATAMTPPTSATSPPGVSVPRSPRLINPTAPATGPGINPFLTMLVGGAPAAIPPTGTTGTNPFQTNVPRASMLTNNPMMTNNPNPGLNPFLTIQPAANPNTSTTPSVATSVATSATNSLPIVNPFM